MRFERDQSREIETTTPAGDDLTVPGQRSRSAEPGLVARAQPIASGILHRKARDGNGVTEGAEHAVAGAATSSGAPLPTTLMRKFEESLGADLSAVRVHTGGASETAASAVGAKAYTIGQDIHFGAGYYDPSSRGGEHLLAHEVAHTVQQGGGVRFKLEVSTPGDAHEVEADRAADAMVSGAPAGLARTSGPAMVSRAPTVVQLPEQQINSSHDNVVTLPEQEINETVEETTYFFAGPVLPNTAHVVSNDVGSKLQDAVAASGCFDSLPNAQQVLADMSQFLSGDSPAFQLPTATVASNFTLAFKKDGVDWEGVATVSVRPMTLPGSATTRQRVPKEVMVTTNKGVGSSSTTGNQQLDATTKTRSTEVSVGGEGSFGPPGAQGGAGGKVNGGVKDTSQLSTTGTSGTSRGTTGAITGGTSAQAPVAVTPPITTAVNYLISVSMTINPTKAVTDRDEAEIAELEKAEKMETANDVILTMSGPIGWLTGAAGEMIGGDPREKLAAARARRDRHKPDSKSTTAIATSRIVVSIPTDACQTTTKTVDGGGNPEGGGNPN